MDIKIILSIKGNDIELSLNEAKKLFDKLGILFDKGITYYPIYWRWWDGNNSDFINWSITSGDNGTDYKITI